MARRDHNTPFQITTGSLGTSTQTSTSSLDSSASFVTDPVFCAHADNLSIQVVVPAGPVGTLVIQVSDDDGDMGNFPANQAPTTLNWTDVSGSSTAISGTTGSPFRFDYPGFTGRWVRLSYTRTSGSGTITARCSSKGVA